MRIAVMIISLVLMLVIGLQSCTSAVGSGVSQTQVDKDAFGQGAAVGVVVTLLYLLGGALVMGLPRISVGLFGLAGLLGLGGGSTTKYHDLTVWGWIAFALAVMSFLGWRGKHQGEIRERAKQQTMMQNAVATGVMMAGGMGQSIQQVVCPRCGTPAAPSVKFCPSCGLERGVPAEMLPDSPAR